VALGGAPGIRSARFASPEEASGRNQDAASRDKLMQALQERSDRTARFRCRLCDMEPGTGPLFYEGVREGGIVTTTTHS
jgi:inosine/xanthosine triphosphate pyrophosphatase family protein